MGVSDNIGQYRKESGIAMAVVLTCQKSLIIATLIF